MNFFEDLRNKPREERKKLLWIITGVASVIIFIIWFILAPKDYLNKDNDGRVHLSDLKGEIQDSFSGTEFDELQDNVDKLKNVSGDDVPIDELTGSADEYSEGTKTENIKPKNRLPLEN